MIIYHQNHIAAFAGGHTVYWPFQPFGGYAPGISTPVQSLNLRIKIGSVELVSSGAVDQPSSGSNVPWSIDCEFVVRSIGASGKVSATGNHDNGQTSGLLANSSELTLNTTIANDVVVSAEHGIASASNTVKVQNLEIERSG